MLKIKKILLLISITFLAILFCGNKSEAVLIVPSSFSVPFEITWVDYDDFLGQRPDEIKVKLLINGSNDYIYVPIRAKDCTVEKVDDTFTTWRGNVDIPTYPLDENGTPVTGDDCHYYLMVGNGIPLSGLYEEHSSGGVARDGDENSFLRATLVTNLSARYNFSVVWDDAGDRDKIRDTIYLDIVNNNNETRELEIRKLKSGDWKTIDNLHMYLFDDEGIPILDKKIEYTFSVQTRSLKGSHERYKFDYDVNGTDVVITVHYDPYRIKPVPVKINWQDIEEKDKLENLQVSIRTENEVYKTIDLSKSTNWEYIFENLYKYESTGMYSMKESEYYLEIEDKENYEFMVNGNQKDGFEIIAKYVPDEEPKQEKIESNEENVKEQDDNKVEHELDNEPKTGIQNYSLGMGISFIISMLGLLICKKIKSK